MKGKAVKPSFTHKQIQNALDYDPQTGIFKWKISPAKNVKVGSRAGGNGTGGYRYIRLLGQEMTEGRLAWFYMKGEWPEKRIKFKNGDIKDCCFENLTPSFGIMEEFDHKSELGRKLYAKAYRKKEPKNQKKTRHLKKYYGISLEKFNEMMESQNGFCAICKESEKRMIRGKNADLSVDHDHKTGKVRGLLCYSCNTGIGKLKDDRNVLLSAVKYLDLHAEPETNNL
jgi:hypothetical protein